MRAWKAAFGTWVGRKGPLVFPTERGHHRDRKPPRGWKAWLKAAGITRRVRWHDLRHTCASALVGGALGRKWSLEEVRALLGHSSIRVTERYAHFGKSLVMMAAMETNHVAT